MTPQQQYQRDLTSKLIRADAMQAEMVLLLDDLFQNVLAWHHYKQSWRRVFSSMATPIGWYCYGGVGIGKTYLLDLFCDGLKSTTVKTKRYHFHHFMRLVHSQLTSIQGIEDPLAHIAKQFAKQCDVLCFDEFMVHDIADAMLLGGLFQHLFANGIVLLATSNCAPDDLYHNGLQRQRFLPAIALLKQHCQIKKLAIKHDYRLHTLAKTGVYFHPMNADSAACMLQCFMTLTSGRGQLQQTITVVDRDIPVMGLGSEVVWFDFAVLCNVGRSAQDYLEIAQSFHTVLLSHVVKLSEADLNRVRLFIFLVDILYDAKVKLIIEASVLPEELYLTGVLHEEYKRTQSRLHEMQSEGYLHQKVMGELGL